jgi:steroid 5-alpha reductase family enzyme
MQRDSFICSPLLPASWLTEFDADFQNLVTDWTTLMLIVTGLCFVVSEITKNHSEVDKLLVTMWGLRLSYNFHRMEDTISSPGGARRITGGKYSGTAPH